MLSEKAEPWMFCIQLNVSPSASPPVFGPSVSETKTAASEVL